jgi:hypothetical protein
LAPAGLAATNWQTEVGDVECQQNTAREKLDSAPSARPNDFVKKSLKKLSPSHFA